MSALSANVSTAKSMLDSTGSACDRLIGALGGGQLSGKGYASAKSVFSGTLKPGVVEMQRAIDDLQKDVEAYTQADSLVSRYGDLDEDRLRAQLVSVKTQRDATERMIDANRVLAASSATLPGVSSSLEAANGQLEMVLVGLEDDIRELEEKLQALEAFNAQTSGLFADPMKDVKRSAQKVSSRVKGGGRLSGSGISTVLLKNKKSDTQKKVDRLLEKGLTPEEVAARWKESGLTPEMLKSLPPEVWLKLAGLSGLPAGAQNEASRGLLKWALKPENTDRAYALFGFTEDWEVVVDNMGNISRDNNSTDVNKKEFRKQLEALNKALNQADKDAKFLDGNPVVQLIGLGNHDGALVAGVSFGDLDTASNVGVNVSGMHSNVGDIGNGNNAAQTLYKNAWNKNKSATYAVVNWIGYRSPKTIDAVQHMDHADSGGKRLASFLDGIHASRTSLSSATNKYPTQFNVYAHSYGTTTAVEALKQTNFNVSVVATYGSAGVKNGTTKQDIHAGKAYATSGPGDNLAHIGYNDPSGEKSQKNLDPRKIPGVITFSSKDAVTPDGTKLKETSAHDQFDPPWFSPNTSKVGYMSDDATSLDRMGTMLAKGSAK